jgi:cystathionine beta-lyase
MSGLDCYLLERGLKTLAIRVRQQNANALHLAQFLLQHPKVKAVHYPGLPSHPSNELAKKQMKGFGGMLAFELKCDGAGLQAFLQTLHMIKVAVSLGGVESTLTLPALTSHAKLSPDERKTLGISDNLCRLSVGIEEIEDLVCDLTRALDILPL